MLVKLPILMVLAGLVQTDDSIDAAQFSRLLTAWHSQYRDVAFLYEGNLRWVGPGHVYGERPAEEFGFSFQGFYVYRNDQSIMIDEYSKRHVDGLSGRKTLALQAGRLEEIRSLPDHDHSKSPIRRGPGAPASFNGLGSPQHIFIIPYIATKSDAAAYGYQHLGWEEIDGFRCLHVQLNRIPEPKNPAGTYIQYWMDVARGGHPLRVEYYVKDKRISRADNIKLAKFEGPDGKSVWLPVSGELAALRWEGRHYEEPLTRESIAIVQGSVVLNRGWPDAMFSLQRFRGPNAVKDAISLTRQLDKLPIPSEYAKLAVRAKPTPTDPAGVDRLLREQLEAADRQSQQLEAASSSNSRWWRQILVQSLFITIGVATLVVTAIYRRRS